MANLIRSETHTGQSITINGFKLTPFSRSLSIHTPGWHAAFLWHRPISVLVQGQDGQEHVLPVIDFTRQVQWILYGIALGTTLLLWFFSRRTQKTNRR